MDTDKALFVLVGEDVFGDFVVVRHVGDSFGWFVDGVS